ncbi:transcription factor HES-3 [Gopherus flavomarginatus]|uniref:transcription factor HES-3 n=1 Tax=Gopherus flavomarginatus TaxID=286002 RepID=UPI0021CC0539|nr:transcription factor HES-3 [Gopherus flavomarginatus]
MEKKRRARINVSLEQLKALLEKHYSHHIRKRKLEKADILELSVKYMKSLQNSVQGKTSVALPFHAGVTGASWRLLLGRRVLCKSGAKLEVTGSLRLHPNYANPRAVVQGERISAGAPGRQQCLVPGLPLAEPGLPERLRTLI